MSKKKVIKKVEEKKAPTELLEKSPIVEQKEPEAPRLSNVEKAKELKSAPKNDLSEHPKFSKFKRES